MEKPTGAPKSKKAVRGYAAGPFGQIHYQDTGAGIPLVLIHQAPMSSRQFDSVYDKLAARGLRAIGFDMPGFGMSDVTDFVPRIEDWAKAVPALLDHLNIRKAHALGHHTGALVATEAAIQFPDRIDKLIMNGALPITEPERVERLAKVEKTEKNVHLDPDGKHLTNVFGIRKKLYGPDADPGLITRYVVEAYMGYGPSWYGHWAAYKYDHGAAVKKVKHPTMLLSNSGDMIHERTMRVKEMRPDFTITVLDGGGVDITDQQPDAWADAVAAFLKP